MGDEEQDNQVAKDDNNPQLVAEELQAMAADKLEHLDDSGYRAEGQNYLDVQQTNGSDPASFEAAYWSSISNDSVAYPIGDEEALRALADSEEACLTFANNMVSGSSGTDSETVQAEVTTDPGSADADADADA